MTSKAKILIIDDEANIRLSLEELLTQDGHHIVAAETGEAALKHISNQQFDLALVDLKLPGIDGIDVVKNLKQHAPETIAIVLTAHATLETAIAALRQGAHDYLFKPCDPIQLRESVRQGLLNRRSNVQQRDLIDQLENLRHSLDTLQSTMARSPTAALSSLLTQQPPDEQRRFLQYGMLTVDLLQHVITLDGGLLDLTPTEFELLAYLVKQAPRIVSSKELIQKVQGYESEHWEAKETVRSHIYHIRQKIRKIVGSTDVIRTVRGVGYTIAK